ncbi:MAG: hypothetical protein HY842_00910 [Bacteroidetes bacterium]|nr:hypothetical protein [Bacteroidota bacterium]
MSSKQQKTSFRKQSQVAESTCTASIPERKLSFHHPTTASKIRFLSMKKRQPGEHARQFRRVATLPFAFAPTKAAKSGSTPEVRSGAAKKNYLPVA